MRVNSNLLARSARNSGNRSSRGSLNPLPRVLIVCQGEKTEVNYFRAFRVADVEVVYGNGDPLQVVAHAEALFAKNRRVDQVWCVFDRDEFPQFDAAIRKIENLQQEKKPYFAAWSNYCFELWFLLHFEYLQTNVHREHYGAKISVHLKSKYHKNDSAIRDRLMEFETTAIANASRLEQMHDQDGTELPSKQCPMTTVGRLVKVLRDAREGITG